MHERPRQPLAGRLLLLLSLFAFASCSSNSPKPSSSSIDALANGGQTEIDGNRIIRSESGEDAGQPTRSDPWEFVCIAEDLHTPAAVAVQPQTGHVFVSTVNGVFRVDPENQFPPTAEIAKSTIDAYGRGPVYQFGPLGLCFADSSTLIVGEGGKLDGEDSVLIFTVGKEPSAEPLSWDQHIRKVGPISRGDLSHRGEGNFQGVVVFNQLGFASSHGDDTKGWLSRFELDSADDRLTPFASLKTLTDRDGPTGIVAHEGKLLVALTGELNERPDSLVVLIDPETGDADQLFETELYDITGIAASSDGDAIYAVDFAWAEPERGGLYSLRLSGAALEKTRHAEFTHPTGVAVTANGRVVVCCVEDQGEDEDAPAAGKLYIRRPATEL